MTMKKMGFWGALLALPMILAACSSPSPEISASPTPQPDTVLTAAAQTAEARLTELAQPTAMATETQLPTEIATTPAPQATGPAITATLTLSLSPTAPGVLPTGGVLPTAGAATSGDLAEFNADVTIPDGTDLGPGESFTKTWRIRNAGTTTWTTEYSFVFVGGAQMDAPASVPLPSSVAPGETVDISVNMVAPQETGNYRGFWGFQNAAGELFQTSVYVEIDVVGGSAAAGGTTSPTGGDQVSNVTISVDEASPDECPHTFAFTAGFSLDDPGNVTYKLEADVPFEITLPPQSTGSFEAGAHSVPYTLEFTSSVTGTAQFHIVAPEDVTSEPVAFELSCDS